MEIKNYRSLEHVQIEDLSKFNVLIGRNNTGKSSVFGALALLGSLVTQTTSVEFDRVLTDLQTSRSLEIRMTFELSTQEREDFIRIIRSEVQGQERQSQLLLGSLLKRIDFFFKAQAGRPELLHLRELRVVAEDGQWATVQTMTGPEHVVNPSSRITRLVNVAAALPAGVLNSTSLDVGSAAAFGGSSLADEFKMDSGPFESAFTQDPAITWLRARLARFFEDAYFFDPFRHSSQRLPVQEQPELARDGSNLAQVLHNINSDDRALFTKIEQFVHGALPDIGTLQTPLVSGSHTEVAFRSPVSDYRIRLNEMGGGIEQLLMAATVLLTRGPQSTLFLEEPESHLHTGAQRFLIEELRKEERQVFITTHSPTFINVSGSRSLYQVTYAQGRTSIAQAKDADSLDEVLEDIGARNSDMLLSDAVLFVEGPSDERALSIWSDTLNIGLAEQNVTLLVMGGGEFASRSAPLRSELLSGISQRSPVPHLFVVDRDQRNSQAVSTLENRLGDRVHVLRARELENYLLVPRALREALSEKCKTDSNLLRKLHETSNEDIEQLIRRAVDDLYGIILLKRIRAELGSLRQGFVTPDTVTVLATEASLKSLPQKVYRAVKAEIAPHLTKARIEEIVITLKKTLDDEWQDPDQREYLAPGAEILDAVFGHFGVRYRKPADTVRIAQHMSAGEIAPEIMQLLRKASGLAARV